MEHIQNNHSRIASREMLPVGAFSTAHGPTCRHELEAVLSMVEAHSETDHLLVPRCDQEYHIA